MENNLKIIIETIIDSNSLNNVQKKLTDLNKTELSFFDKLRSKLKSLSTQINTKTILTKGFSSIQEGLSIVADLDTAFVDLRKTANMTARELENFYYSSNDIAKQMGVTTKEIISQAAAWSRLGFSNAEAAAQMARLSSQFKLISPGMTSEQATSGLSSIMKAYDIDVNHVLDGIMSKINIIGDTFALSNTDIISMLQDSVSAMAAGNNTLEETIALETAALEIAQNGNVGNGFKTAASRLRGLNEETQIFDESLVTIKDDLYDLTGVSIMSDADTYKSTYQILKDIREVWSSLSDETQTTVLELIFGKNSADIGAAVINNFDAVDRALDEMAHSAGNAEAEMAVAMDSISYKMNILKETGTGIAQNLFAREDMKTVLDIINSIGRGIDWLTEKLGLFGSLGAGAGLFAGIKNVGRDKMQSLKYNCFELPTIICVL